MARIARVIVPNIPHHVTQRGNRKLTTFFIEDDYNSYEVEPLLDIVGDWGKFIYDADLNGTLKQ
jgi:putative transposase